MNDAITVRDVPLEVGRLSGARLTALRFRAAELGVVLELRRIDSSITQIFYLMTVTGSKAALESLNAYTKALER